MSLDIEDIDDLDGTLRGPGIPGPRADQTRKRKLFDPSLVKMASRGNRS